MIIPSQKISLNLLKEEIMTVEKNCFVAMIVFVLLISFAGCTSYERQVVPFKMPQESPNAVNVDGTVIAARGFVSVEEAREAFGFDVRSAGILPVQVAFDNKKWSSAADHCRADFSDRRRK
jgi:hypothetical protein